MSRVDRDLKRLTDGAAPSKGVTFSVADKRYRRTNDPLGIGDVVGLQAALDAAGGGGSPAWASITGKPSTFPPEAHGHQVSDVAGLATALTGKADAVHGHAVGDVSGLQAALDGKQGLGMRPGLGSLFKPAAALWVPNSWNGLALGTGAQAANRHIIAPFVPSYAMTVDQVGVSVSTLLAGANCKVTIFDSDADGRPTTLLRESGDLSAASAATVTGAITSIALAAGKLYWIGVRSSGTQTLRTLGVSALPVLSVTTAATPVMQSTLLITETYATAAANWSYASSQHSNTVMPLVLLRTA